MRTRYFIFVIGSLIYFKSAAESYYDREPCQSYRAQDFPVVVFPWDDKGDHCYSLSAIQDLKIFGHSTLAESLEAKVAEEVKQYGEFQNNVAETLLCCASSDPKCRKIPEVASFCDGDNPQSGFNAYLKDLNDRLKALRLASYRIEGRGYPQGAEKRPISTPKPFLMKKFEGVIPDVISFARMPNLLSPLTEEELQLAHNIQKKNNTNYAYQNFFTENPENDYFVILNSAPFLGEISKSKIDKADLYKLMKAHVERNKNDNIKFQNVYYRDFIPAVSENIKKYTQGEAQRNLCRYAEFRMRLSKAGVVVLKQMPLVVATLYGGARGLKVNPGASISEIAKNLGVSIGKASAPAVAISGGVDLYRTKQLDGYCQKKTIDDDVNSQAPLCNQAAVLSSLDQTQTNIIVGSAINSGFLAFRYGKQLKSKLPSHQ